jgi:hypothetical protein
MDCACTSLSPCLRIAYAAAISRLQEEEEQTETVVESIAALQEIVSDPHRSEGEERKILSAAKRAFTFLRVRDPTKSNPKAIVIVSDELEEASDRQRGIQIIIDIINQVEETCASSPETPKNLHTAQILIGTLKDTANFNNVLDALNNTATQNPILRPIVPYLINIVSIAKRSTSQSMKAATAVLQNLERMKKPIKALIIEKGLGNILGRVEHWTTDPDNEFQSIRTLLHIVLKSIKKIEREAAR